MLNKEPIPEHPNPLCDDCDGRGWMEDFENIRGNVRWACETCRYNSCAMPCKNSVTPCDSPERVDLYQRTTSASNTPARILTATLCSYDCAKEFFLIRSDNKHLGDLEIELYSFENDFRIISFTLRELPEDHPSVHILVEIQDELNLAFEREINTLKRRMSRAQVGDQ